MRFHSFVGEVEGDALVIDGGCLFHDGPPRLGREAVVEVEQRQHHGQGDKEHHHRNDDKAHVNPYRQHGAQGDWRHQP